MKLKEMDVRLTLLVPQLGTLPKDEKIFSNFIADKVNVIKEKHDEEVETLPLDESLSLLEKRGYTGFHQDEQGLFIYDYMIRGFLKAAGNTLKNQVSIKALKSKIDNLVFVYPRKIYFREPTGEFVTKPHGIFERSLRVDTPQGPRVCLSRSDLVNEGCTLDIKIKIVDNSEVTEKKILEIFEYGELKGLGQFRNGSFGRFSTELIK